MLSNKEVKELDELKEVKEKNARCGPVRNYSDLIVYQQSYRLALQVSQMTKLFPREEQFELGRQVRRCSRCVAANIVEGWAKRTSTAEFKRHLLIASGEAAETKFWLDLAADERLAARSQCEELKTEYAKLGMIIHNLWKEWRKIS